MKDFRDTFQVAFYDGEAEFLYNAKHEFEKRLKLGDITNKQFIHFMVARYKDDDPKVKYLGKLDAITEELSK